MFLLRWAPFLVYAGHPRPAAVGIPFLCGPYVSKHLYERLPIILVEKLVPFRVALIRSPRLAAPNLREGLSQIASRRWRCVIVALLCLHKVGSHSPTGRRPSIPPWPSHPPPPLVLPPNVLGRDTPRWPPLAAGAPPDSHAECRSLRPSVRCCYPCFSCLIARHCCFAVIAPSIVFRKCALLPPRTAILMLLLELFVTCCCPVRPCFPPPLPFQKGRPHGWPDVPMSLLWQRFWWRLPCRTRERPCPLSKVRCRRHPPVFSFAPRPPPPPHTGAGMSYTSVLCCRTCASVAAS